MSTVESVGSVGSDGTGSAGPVRSSEFPEFPESSETAVPGPAGIRVPPPSFAHLLRLTDDTGIFEHARGSIPKRWHGYCVDDVSRALIVVCREPHPDPTLIAAAEIYLAFLLHAQDDVSGFHNRLAVNRVWQDEPATLDWWGRALWALGTAAAHAPTPGMRAVALECFETGANQRSVAVRAMVFAALGAAEVLTADPGHKAAHELLADAAAVIGRPASDPAWVWPQDKLAYANAALAEVLIAAGYFGGDARTLEDGLRALAWLLAGETAIAGHFAPTPNTGWVRGEPRGVFDQQPIEAAAMADACTRAHAVTGDPGWMAGVRRATFWFLGDNDLRLPLLDSSTGGCCDGLGRRGRNPNQGAESTIALISTLQRARRWWEQGRPQSETG
ncbi:MAG: glycosyltransferase [Catenulisporales bacterium]|nr:glycosyltransferase [Catenulisporales bacterium]